MNVAFAHQFHSPIPGNPVMQQLHEHCLECGMHIDSVQTDTGELPCIRQKLSVDQHIGKQLKKLRLSHGMSQHAFGQWIDMLQARYSKVERGTLPLSAAELFGIAAILQVPVSFFLP
jgi:DNA-binding XRE family transcriptional regulator